MLVLTIIFVVTIAGSGTSLVIYPERIHGRGGSEFHYDLQPKGSGYGVSDVQEEPNKGARYISKNEDSSGRYRSDEQKLDDVPKYESYRAAPEEDKENDAGIAEYDEPKREEYREEKLDESSNRDDDTTKSNKSEDVKEAEAEENNENNDEKEEINNEKDSEEVKDDSSEESDEKSNENYEDSEEEDAFKWPTFEEYKYKGYDDFDTNRGFGNYGKFGKYGSFGGYTGFRSGSKFGCLELGHGEYC